MVSTSCAIASAVPGAAGEVLVGTVDAVVVGVAVGTAEGVLETVTVGAAVGAPLAATLALGTAEDSADALTEGSTVGIALGTMGEAEVDATPLGMFAADEVASGVGDAPSAQERPATRIAPTIPKEVIEVRVEPRGLAKGRSCMVVSYTLRRALSFIGRSREGRVRGRPGKVFVT